MTGALAMRRRLVRSSIVAVTWAATVVAVGCSGQEPADEALEVSELGEPDEEDASQEERRDRRRPFLPDEMQRSTRVQSFPHEPHVRIDCAVCHEEVRGHGSHTGVSCAECHRASAEATLTSVAPADCLACHHGAGQTLGCEACHAAPGPVLSAQTLHLDVWEAPRTREIAFDHGRHEGLTCGECHTERPALAAEPCTSCHEAHHTSQLRCATCHLPPAEGVHGIEVHRGCGGTGCHDEPLVEERAATRPVCLVCHQQREDHEPGGACVDCHKVGSDLPMAGAVPGAIHRPRELRGSR